jgi:histidine triad (HIT) family protein
MAFKDISPQAPEHFLVVPRKPITKLSEISEQDVNVNLFHYDL